MRKKVLIIDDAQLNRHILAEMLENDYEVIEADNGQAGLELLKSNREDLCLVLLDLIMPVMDGFGVIEKMAKSGDILSIPILVISVEQSVEAERKCLELGVADFIRKPFDTSLVMRRVKNVVDLYSYRHNLEEQVAKQTKALKEQYEMIRRQAQELRAKNEKITDILAEVVESRNLESGEHVKRVKAYTGILARELMVRYPEYNLTEKKIRIIESASALHDIGKIVISDAILLKPGRFTDEEFEIMKTHTSRGSEVLDNIHGVWDEMYKKYAYEICKYHHERYDGHGYPEGLVGDNIPISAQIVSVADVYDALISVRCYKKAFTKEEAFNMIISGDCGMFSPKMMDCFKHVRWQFENVSRECDCA
jgi:putative two-component system response regulator